MGSRCECGSCRTGSLVPGHCINIDGEAWHDCFAWDLADKKRKEREAIAAAQAELREEVARADVPPVP